jgi:RimJ/RimL family protein N-acetyltransferase
MADDDLQIGATFTRADSRGKGFAQLALNEAVRQLAKPGRAFWYLTDVANQASCRVAERAGFEIVGHGSRVPRLGVGALGAYRILNRVSGTGRIV